MKLIVLLTLAGLFLFSFAPIPAVADHGVVADYMIQFPVPPKRPSPQQFLNAHGEFLQGSGDNQEWQFEFFRETTAPLPTQPWSNSCLMVGSIEAGFTVHPVAGCELDEGPWDESEIAIDGTGHHHSPFTTVPDQHAVQVHYSGGPWNTNMTAV